MPSIRRRMVFSGVSAVVFSALLLSAGCSRKGAGTGARAAVPVQVAKVEQKDLPRVQRSIGTVQAVRTVVVKSQVDGVIQSVHFREGAPVAKGDLLVSLDARPFRNALDIARADLAMARAEAEQARNDLERYEKLRLTNNISKEQYNQYLTKRDTTVAQVQAKEGAVANAELQLGYCEIRAPISGRAGQLRLHEGALVKANDANTGLVTLNQVSPVEVAFTVPEDDVPAVRAAQKAGPVPVRVVPQGGASGAAEGALSFVDNAVDPTTGTLTLKATFPNGDEALWPGQFVEIETRLGLDRAAVTIPIGAVQNGQGGSQVFVVRADDTVELRPVSVLSAREGIAVVAGGLRPGETVVTDGQIRLVPGARVVVRPLEDVPPAALPPRRS